jgi:hypothetical protein
MTLAEMESLIKSQKVRAFDIYVLGPFMMWYSVKSKGMSAWPRRALFISGFMTTLYNYENYKKVKTWVETEGASALKNPLEALSQYTAV